jgi:anti-sigma regulatory factor (Ser/Thr protein kinase)
MWLAVESRPVNVALVRRVMRAFGEQADLAPQVLDDLTTAVSEASNNVIQHAYADGSGPLTVSVSVNSGTLEARVIDRGTGIGQAPMVRRSQGVGLAVMTALADRAEFSSPDAGGTEVRLVFDSGTDR